ncbi:MAG TPA: hypothetical protein VN329_00950 [Roseomonas sp.]|nr:hypothetical protein [Roseomonas sp.]
MSAWDSAGLVRQFRHHPDVAGGWLYMEEWPFRAIWALAGATPVATGDHAAFGRHALTRLEAFSDPLGASVMLWIGWRRRTWLRQNAQRVDPHLWDRATPLA